MEDFKSLLGLEFSLYGALTGDQLVERYAATSGRSVESTGWYVALAYYKLAIISEGIHARYLLGMTVGPGFDHMGSRVPALIDRAQGNSRYNVIPVTATRGSKEERLRRHIPLMRKRRYGRILLFGVAGGESPRAAARAHAYRAAKVALLTLAKSLAQEEAPHGITVNVILPGIIRPAFSGKEADLVRRIPAGRLGSPREIARAALFLLAEESGYITGAALPVAGGYLL